jgi:hypothetical protein
MGISRKSVKWDGKTAEPRPYTPTGVSARELLKVARDPPPDVID